MHSGRGKHSGRLRGMDEGTYSRRCREESLSAAMLVASSNIERRRERCKEVVRTMQSGEWSESERRGKEACLIQRGGCREREKRIEEG
jgi:hypothetical protein